MNSLILFSSLALSLLLTIPQSAVAQTSSGERVVVTDGDIEIAAGLIKHVYDNAPAQIRSQISKDPSARYELIANAVVAHRILRNLSVASTEASDIYFEFLADQLTAAKKFDEKRFQRQLKVPDLAVLAQERWRISKTEIATVPEKRSLSHILLLCSEGCDEAEKTAKLADIRQRIADGESFSDLALEFSQDPGSKQRGGRLSRSISLADENVDQTFRDTAFTLTEVGEISEVVQSRFGFHIMRLEAIEPEREYTFEEVKEPLMAEIEKRYREDAYRDYVLSMEPTEALRIDEEAIDSIMGKLPDVEEVAPAGD